MATTSTSSDNNYVMNNNISDVVDDGEELLRQVMVEVNSLNDDEIKPISVISNSSSTSTSSSDKINAVDVDVDVDDNGDEFLRTVMVEAMATLNSFSSTTTSVLLPNTDTNANTYVDDTAAVVAAVAANSQYMELYQNHPYYCDYSNNDDDVVNDNNNDNAATAAAAAPSTTIALPVVNNYDTLSTTTSTTTTTVADVMAKSYNTNKNGDNDAVTVTITTTNIAGHDDTTATKADDDVGNDEGNTNNHNHNNNNDRINEGIQKIKTEPRDNVWVLYNGNNININSSRCAMKNDIENSKCDGPTNRKRTRDQSEDDESCDDTDDNNIDIDDYQDEDDEDDEDESLPEDSTDSNQNKDSKSPVVRGKRRRIDNKSLHDTNWEKTFQRLVAYKEIHKHTMVPSHYDEDPPLGLWVSRQRYQYRNDELPSNRLDLLNSIDFAWNLYDKTWRRMFKKLVVYKEKHKNTMVPSQYDEDPKFGKWVSQQRGIYKNDDMPSNRLDLLNSIDFEWEGVQGKKYEKWDDVFQKLVAYNKLHKHTMVPKPYDEDPPLGRWVSTQRKVFNKNKLLKVRLDKLNSIGFVWRVLR